MTQSTFSGVIVGGHTTVRQEQAKGVPPTEAIAEGLGQIAFTRNAQEFLFGPSKKGIDLRAT